MESWVSRFSPSTLRRVAVATGFACIALILGELVLAFASRNAMLGSDLQLWDFPDVLDMLTGLGVPVIGTILASRAPANKIGWLFLVAAIGIAVSGFSQEYAVYALRTDPGALPAARLFAWLSGWTWPIAVCMLLYLFLLFPTGHLRSRRWRPVGWAAGGLLAFLTLGSLILATVGWSQPLAQNLGPSSGAASGFANLVFLVALVAFPVVLISSFVCVALRFRSSIGEERLQLKWFATAAALVAITFGVSFSSQFSSPVISIAGTLSLLFLYASIGIAVLKYRLYEIDVVIGKTVVFALLAAFITAVYIALVVGIGTAVGDRGSPVLSAIAAAVVAIAFQPVRARARRLANRVVYGKRATPYEVLSGFSSRASETYSTEDVLPRLVKILAEGIGANEARVWLRVGSELRLEAAWPVNGDVPAAPISGDELPPFADRERAFPVRHGGELLGAISVVTSASDPLGPDRERLVEDVAAQTALVLANVRLIEELRESRRRIVTAQDERAKALERNLHDGAQQQLVALAVKQRLAGSLVERDPAKAKAMLDDIQAETQEALENLRDLARGIYPPLLADQGLGAALEGQARKAALPVAVETESLGRYPQEVEAAVYFCCLEALQNVAKYAEASTATVRLVGEDGVLRFEVRDDGVGFDPRSTSFGSGLQGMADRLDAIRGSLHVRSAPGEGTTITGTVTAGGRSPA
jgi:signal transduction histidine kinase